MPKDDRTGREQAQQVEIIVLSLKNLRDRRASPEKGDSCPEKGRLQHCAG
jgi:hypothetical protein